LVLLRSIYIQKRKIMEIDYFADNHCNIKKEDGRIGQMNLRDFQKEIINEFKKNKFNILMSSRQMGKTTSIAILILHAVLFSSKVVLIVSNKSETSKEILRKIKDIYKLLPFYLKQGVSNWNQASVIFENGSRIQTMTRVKEVDFKNYDIVYIDEFAHIPVNFINEIYKNITKYMNDDAKIIISSTPNGNNLFYELVQNSERKEGDPLKNLFKQ